MIGVFDSGVGGMAAYTELRRLLPTSDLVYLADRKNAPYGTKSPDELLRLVSEDVRILRTLGAKIILMACCTASTVWQRMPERDRAIAMPIIRPTAKRAVEDSRGHVAVIATAHTAKSHAFAGEIARAADEFFKKDPPRVTEIAAQPLVSLVENGERDGRITRLASGVIADITDKIRESGADTLILGCTHFSHLERTIGDYLPGVRVISAAREGAVALAEKMKEENGSSVGNGRTVYL